MRLLLLLGMTALVFFLSANVLDAQPVLRPGEAIMDGGNPLDVSLGGGWGHAIPWVVDWNNDGAKDMLVGRYDGGHILLYLNQGTDITPVFNGYTLIQTGGVDLVIPPD